MINFKRKKGISLIVLVLTIVIMIILATTMLLTLSNSGIISKANEAIEKTDLNQIKTLAATLWADAFMEGKRGTELVNSVKSGLLEIDKDYESKYEVEITDKNVIVNLKSYDWETIYEGDVYTSNQKIVLDSKYLFNDIYRSTYRITLESDEYTGVFETKLIVATASEKVEYLLGVIQNGSIMTFSSSEEAYQEIASLQGAYTIITGEQTTQNGVQISSLSFGNATSEYKVKKIERKTLNVPEITGKLIYEGVSNKGINSLYLPEINLDIRNRYILVRNEELYSIYAIGIKHFEIVPYDKNNTYVGGISESRFLSKELDGYITIYENGTNPNIVVEGEEVIMYKDSKWIHIGGSRITPNIVAGYNVSAVNICSVSEVYYDGSVELVVEPIDRIYNEANFKLEVASNVDPNDIYRAFLNSEEFAPVEAYIDMSAFSDLNIPNELTYKVYNIYVSEAVKAKYPDEDRIQIKP